MGLFQFQESESSDDPEEARRLTAEKHAAMQTEASSFYSRYPGQTWKNILSIGDMSYEHDAVHELSAGRKTVGPFRERLRTKAMLVPQGPSVGELSLRLEFLRLMLPAYVCFDGNVSLDLRATAEPLQALAMQLEMPQLAGLAIPLNLAWGLDVEEEVSHQAMGEALAHLGVTVHDWLNDSTRFLRTTSPPID
jgi:hypothetical protein